MDTRQRSINDVFNDIIAELPWVKTHRLIVGDLASREAVKDTLLEKTPIMPAWAVCTLTEYATEICTNLKTSVEKPLSSGSQCDALEKISSSSFLKETIPQFCAHLRSRQVAKKVARFITHLDRFYSNEGELAAIVEYFASKDKQLGVFLGVVAKLWEHGELSPWGDGSGLREALRLLEANCENAPFKKTLPTQITLWGFAEFTPLEELVLQALVGCGVKIRMLVPSALHSLFASRGTAMGIEITSMPESSPRVESWLPHSAWDEFEYLRDSLAELKLQGVLWRDVAIFIPNDDLYKRFARQKLHEWNVPLQDPTLSGGWKDQPRWIWWRDLLRTISSGLKLEDVRAWLGPGLVRGLARREILQAAHERGLHGGARQWEKLLEKHDLPEVRVLVEGVRTFSRAMTPTQFLEAAESFVPIVEKHLGTDALESSLLLEFAHHVCEERPYLSEFRSRLPRYVALFEEFLETKSRTQSVRSEEGVKFVGHGVWLPSSVKHSFVLGVNMIPRAKPGADVWDWEGVEVRAAWEKLHFGLSWADRVKRDDELVKYSFLATQCVRYSAVEYSLLGKPSSRGVLFAEVCDGIRPTVKGGHPAVGWNVTDADDLPKTISLLRPDLVADKPLSVSAFEDYLKCPFLYFARHILKLEREEELGLDPNGRARGILLHRVLGQLIEDEMQKKFELTRESGQGRLDTLINAEVARELGAGRTLSGMYRHKPLIDATVALIKSQALRWLEWELEKRKKFPHIKPFAVEAPLELELTRELTLRGRADRIDTDGKHSIVIDYKTGGAPYTGGELTNGIGAQLLVYAQGAQIKHGLEPAVAYYIGVGRKIEATKGVFLKKHNKILHETNARNGGLYDGEFGTLFERVSENWSRAAQTLKQGNFSPSPSRPKKDCEPCHYKRICGYKPSDAEKVNPSFPVPSPSIGGDGE